MLAPVASSPPFARSTSSSFERVSELADLGAIFDGELNAVAWPRVLEAAVCREAHTLLAAPVSSSALAVTADDVGRRALARDLPGMPALVDELFFWVEALCELLGCPAAGLRLTRLERAMCPAFHVDRVASRLVLTLVGTGTEIVEERAGEARRLRTARALAAIASDDPCIRRVVAGEVLLLKGECWPGNEGRGAIHRSPAASATPRLLLTLDPLA